MSKGKDEDKESLIDHCALECIRAYHSKDKEAFSDAFRALVSDILMDLMGSLNDKD